jgi:hypothetical protein
MLEETDLLQALKRHWDFSGKDEDASHEIYHDDAVLEFPQSGERFEGVENFRECGSSIRRSSSSTPDESPIVPTWSL